MDRIPGIPVKPISTNHFIMRNGYGTVKIKKLSG